jgi:hypothetical protein
MYFIPTVELLRVETNKKYGTLGLLKIGKRVFCMTLEPGDNSNKSDISSIPTGQYPCKKYFSKKYGWTFEITDVTGRTYILFHSGNILKHTKGCVLLGQHVGKLYSGKRAVLNSGYTFRLFMRIFREVDEFHLTISERY